MIPRKSISLWIGVFTIAAAGPALALTWYLDMDGDGWGSCENSIEAETKPDGYAWQCPDCNDAQSEIHPGAWEIPGNGIDENCDGSDAPTCYADTDNDGSGDPGNILFSVDGDCDDPGESYTGGDCNDTDGAVYPGATEIYDDGIDQDCDGVDMSDPTPTPKVLWSQIKAFYR